VVEKIVAGKLEGFFAEQCLVDQPYIRDDKKTIGNLVDEASAELKEPVKIKRFAWFKVGGE
jgi:elongation factor Ts